MMTRRGRAPGVKQPPDPMPWTRGLREELCVNYRTSFSERVKTLPAASMRIA